MFGSEQSLVQSRFSLKIAFKLLGDFRFPIYYRYKILENILGNDIHPRVIWDAGCGEGQTSFWLSNRYPNAKIICTDVKKENIEHNENISNKLKKSNMSFLQDDILDGVDRKVDLIVCFEVLEHIDNYEKAIKVFFDSLSKNGILVIHTPADNCFQSPNYGLRKYFKNINDINEIIIEKGQYHIHPGFEVGKLQSAIENSGLMMTRFKFTFGPTAMIAHNIYEWTRSRSKFWQLISSLPLRFLGFFDLIIPSTIGGGLLVVAKK